MKSSSKTPASCSECTEKWILRDILIQSVILLRSFQRVSLDKTFNLLFDELRRRNKSDSNLFRNLCNEIIMLQCLPCFHYTNDCSLYKMTALLLHERRKIWQSIGIFVAWPSAFPCNALCRFLHTYQRDLNLFELTFVAIIQSKGVVVATNMPSFPSLPQNTVFVYHWCNEKWG